MCAVEELLGRLILSEPRDRGFFNFPVYGLYVYRIIVRPRPTEWKMRQISESAWDVSRSDVTFPRFALFGDQV